MSMQLKGWLRKLPTWVVQFLGIIVAIVLWPVVICILLIDNLWVSIRQFYQYFKADLEHENKAFVEFFKSLIGGFK